MGSKNNPTNRGETTNGKVYKGKKIKPVEYVGTHIGHGRYIAAQYEDTGDMLFDSNKKPIAWGAI